MPDNRIHPQQDPDAAGPLALTSTSGLVVFSILAGGLATFTLGYSYGINNHIELLLPVMRLLDPGFCAGDFTVDASAGYDVRFFYAWLCAGLARLAGLPAAMLLLTWLQNIGVALVTAFVARDMHGRKTLAPLVAVILVLSVESIQLGDAGFLRQAYGWPAILSLVAALPALWLGIRLRPLPAMALAMLATLIHPLIGVETGGLALGICALSALRNLELAPPFRRRTAGLALLAIGGLGLFTLLVWGPVQSLNFLETRDFLDIYARFRVPHHILPSRFSVQDYLAALCFLCAAGVSWWWWRRLPETGCRLPRGILLGTGLVLGLLVCGWFFVEVLPSRLWITLQTFRLVFVLKWFGLLLFAGTIGRAWTAGAPGAAVSGWLLLLPVGQARPLAVLWAHAVEVLRRRIPARQLRRIWPLIAVSGLAGMAGLLAIRLAVPFASEALTMASCLVLLACFRWFSRPAWRYAAALLWTAAIIGLLVANRAAPVPLIGRLIQASNPILTLADARDPADRIAVFCRDALPKGTVVLAPPHLGRFRLVAERALVVDFKCPTTRDASLLEWRRRLAECYGPVTGGGFKVIDQMNEYYRRLTDAELTARARRYGATFAVLFTETPTLLETPYADENFKLVRIPLLPSESSGAGP